MDNTALLIYLFVSHVTYAEKNWDLTIPGYSSEEKKYQSKPVSTKLFLPLPLLPPFPQIKKINIL